MVFSRSWLPAVTICVSSLALAGLGGWKVGLLSPAEGKTPLLATFHPHSQIAGLTDAPRKPGEGVDEMPDVLADAPLPIPIPFEVQSGETLSTVLTGFGLDYPEALRVIAALESHVDPNRVRAGTPYTAILGEQERLEAFRMEIDGRGEVTARLRETEWQTDWREYTRTVEVRAVTGTLEGALESSIRAAGGSPQLTYAMADALQWDLDFNRDLRLGDRFAVVYEQVFLDGKDQGAGRILALNYKNLGRTLEAYRFGDDDGFYDAEGRPLRKMFLRSPLRYSARITSGFSRNRFHPVLKRNRPHWGVDYGAPVGTPVRVTAGGTVVSAGWNGGGGRTVKVRHPNDYETAYLHLSRFAEGMRRGSRVKQGQVVGFVGASGLATGPHLDYRVKHKGRWINPVAIKSVPANPIAQKDLPRYVQWRDSLRHSLKTGEPLGESVLALQHGGPASRLEPDAPDAPLSESPLADSRSLSPTR